MDVWRPGDGEELTFKRKRAASTLLAEAIPSQNQFDPFSMYSYWLKSIPICLEGTLPSQALVRSLALILGDEHFLGSLCPPAMLHLFYQMSHLWVHWYASPVVACLFTAHLLLCKCQATKQMVGLDVGPCVYLLGWGLADT